MIHIDMYVEIRIWIDVEFLKILLISKWTDDCVCVLHQGMARVLYLPVCSLARVWLANNSYFFINKIMTIGWSPQPHQVQTTTTTKEWNLTTSVLSNKKQELIDVRDVNKLNRFHHMKSVNAPVKWDRLFDNRFVFLLFLTLEPYNGHLIMVNDDDQLLDISDSSFSWEHANINKLKLDLTMWVWLILSLLNHKFITVSWITDFWIGPPFLPFCFIYLSRIIKDESQCRCHNNWQSI